MPGARKPGRRPRRGCDHPPDRLAVADVGAASRAALCHRRGRNRAELHARGAPAGAARALPARDRAFGERVPSFVRPGAGSAATATAIPSSPPIRCAPLWAAPARRCSASTSTRSMRWARNCRSRRSTSPSTPRSSAGRRERRHRRKLAASDNAALPASMPPTTKLTGKAAPRPGHLTGEPYADPQAFRADLVAIAHGLSLKDSALGRWGPVARSACWIRAVETFGFHLATLDLRQNSAVHERVVAAAQDRRGRGGLSVARRGRARRFAPPRACACPPARQPLHHLFGGNRSRAEDRARRGRSACEIRAGMHHQLYRLDGAVGVRPARDQPAAEGGRALPAG